MKVNNLKELQKVITFCRKQGVVAIKIDGIELQLGSMPKKANKPVDFSQDFPEANIKVPTYNNLHSGNSAEEFFEQEAVETPDELSEEQLLYYSSADRIEQ